MGAADDYIASLPAGNPLPDGLIAELLDIRMRHIDDHRTT